MVKSHGINTPLEKIKVLMSLTILIFSITIVLALIFTKNTQFARDIHPAFAAVLLWVLIIWMSMIEGGQCSMVGLPPVDRELYRESHPITYKITGWGHKGDNLDRYLMGRQFMVIFVNFTISLCGGTLANAEVFNLPGWLSFLFLDTGLAMVFQNVIVGQLTSQVNASHMMLDYINNYFMVFTYWVAAGIEVTGVMHTSYLIRMMSYWAAGKPVYSNEPPKEGLTLMFYWGRILFSLFVLCSCFAVTIEALFAGQTNLWEGCPEVVGLVLFFVLMCWVGLLEGMQIAFFTVAKLPKSERGQSPLALKTCHCLFKNGGRNLPGFMCGRQMTVTLCFFIIARVTTINTVIGGTQNDTATGNIFNVSDGLQTFFNFGFCGALITTILGSISWQLVAGAFPIAFLNNPIVFATLYIALAIEGSGLMSAAWFLAAIQKKIFKFQLDEVYVGTPEERAAKGHADDTAVDETRALGTFLPANEIGKLGLREQFEPLESLDATYSNKREGILANIKEIRQQITLCVMEEEKEAFEEALQIEIKSLSRLNKKERDSISSTDDLKMAEEE
jgi:silicon transporter